MITGMYAVRDAKANAFLSPNFFPSRGIAMREFGDAMVSEKSFMFKHPEDFSLWYLGEFNDQSGNVKTQPAPELICNGLDFSPQTSNSKG